MVDRRDVPQNLLRPAAALLAALLVALAPVAPAAEDDPEFLRLRVRRATETLTLEGRVVLSAVDGGVLLELADQRYEILQPDEIGGREPLDSLALPETPRDLGLRVLAELPSGFDVLVTKHYVVCFDTTRDYARWCVSLFERLHDAFANYWEKAGLDLSAADRPLVVVIFSSRTDYEKHAAAELGDAAGRVVGYYNLLSNRVTTFDLTGSDALARAGRSPGRAGLDALASPEAAGMVSTLVHEATHQMAFNCGMHQRLAAVPLWVSEGVATYFETPDLRSQKGWRGIGGVNRPRLEQVLGNVRPGMLADIVGSDEAFRDPAGALDAYARAWALTSFLVSTRKDQFVGYLRKIAAKPPLAEDDAATRNAEFEAAFGQPAEAFEDDVLRHLDRLAAKRP